MSILYVLIDGYWKRAFNMGQNKFSFLDGSEWLDLDDYAHYYDESKRNFID